MADVEMDLDPSRTMAHEDHIDEDLIEYDLDTDAMDGTNNEWVAEDLEIQDVDESHVDNDMNAHVHMETLPDDTAEHPADAMDTLDVLPFPGTAVNDAEMLSDLGHDDDLAHGNVDELEDANAVEGVVVDTAATGLDIPPQETLADGSIQEVPAEDIEEVEEIDFGTVAEEIVDANPPSVADATPQANGEATADEATELRQETNNTAVPQEEQADPPAEEEELTWEEEDDELREPAATSQTIGDVQATEYDERVPEDTGLPSKPDDEEQEEHEEHEEQQRVQETEKADRVNDGVHDEVQEENKVTGGQRYNNGQGVETAVEATREAVTFPSITVQYKGEEFPCFAAADGFFTNTSVLEESIERLLAGFRAELAAELAPDEELVFHVDELGLEFAESTQHDILAGTTLQYVLEIYEMLVQNQDHDHDAGPKTLYTYLFTRSSTSRRLEFLAESAASGKGLDEVIHLFEPAMVHHRVDDSPDDTPAILDEQGDDYPSPGDEPTGGNSGENDDEESAHESGQDAHVDEGTVSLAAVESGDVDTTRLTEESTLVQDTSGDAVRSTEQDADKEPFQGVELETSNDGIEQHEADASDDDEAADPETLGPDGEPVEHHDSSLLVTELVTEAPTTATSTSSTVDGNEIPPVSAIDGGAEDEADDTLVQPPHEGEEDLVEIDWREEGDEEAEDTPADDQTTPAKRARADDELGFDEENDAKRQRSS